MKNLRRSLLNLHGTFSAEETLLVLKIKPFLLSQKQRVVLGTADDGGYLEELKMDVFFNLYLICNCLWDGKGWRKSKPPKTVQLELWKRKPKQWNCKNGKCL